MGRPTLFEISYVNGTALTGQPEVLGRLTLPEALEAIARWMTQADIDLQRVNDVDADGNMLGRITVGVTRG